MTIPNLTGKKVVVNGSLITFLEVLGSGGSAVVYRGNHQRLGEVAVKATILTDEESNLTAKAYSNEVQHLRSIGNHPGVISFYDAGEANAAFGEGGQEIKFGFIVLEWALCTWEEALHLYQEQNNVLGLPPVQVANIMKAVFQAIVHFEEKGVVHADLKPSNVFLCCSPEDLASFLKKGKILPQKATKIADFGTARGRLLASELSPDQRKDLRIFGSPSYMSGEQFQGNLIPGLTDVGTAAAMFCELLTGHLPEAGQGSDVITIGLKKIFANTVQVPLILRGPYAQLVEIIRGISLTKMAERLTPAEALALVNKIVDEEGPTEASEKVPGPIGPRSANSTEEHLLDKVEMAGPQIKVDSQMTNEFKLNVQRTLQIGSEAPPVENDSFVPTVTRLIDLKLVVSDDETVKEDTGVVGSKNTINLAHTDCFPESPDTDPTFRLAKFDDLEEPPAASEEECLVLDDRDVVDFERPFTWQTPDPRTGLPKNMPPIPAHVFATRVTTPLPMSIAPVDKPFPAPPPNPQEPPPDLAAPQIDLWPAHDGNTEKIQLPSSPPPVDEEFEFDEPEYRDTDPSPTQRIQLPARQNEEAPPDTDVPTDPSQDQPINWPSTQVELVPPIPTEATALKKDIVPKSPSTAEKSEILHKRWLLITLVTFVAVLSTLAALVYFLPQSHKQMVARMIRETGKWITAGTRKAMTPAVNPSPIIVVRQTTMKEKGKLVMSRLWEIKGGFSAASVSPDGTAVLVEKRRTYRVVKFRSLGNKPIELKNVGIPVKDKKLLTNVSYWEKAGAFLLMFWTPNRLFFQVLRKDGESWVTDKPFKLRGFWQKLRPLAGQENAEKQNLFEIGMKKNRPKSEIFKQAECTVENQALSCRVVIPPAPWIKTAVFKGHAIIDSDLKNPSRSPFSYFGVPKGEDLHWRIRGFACQGDYLLLFTLKGAERAVSLWKYQNTSGGDGPSRY